MTISFLPKYLYFSNFYNEKSDLFSLKLPFYFLHIKPIMDVPLARTTEIDEILYFKGRNIHGELVTGFGCWWLCWVKYPCWIDPDRNRKSTQRKSLFPPFCLLTSPCCPLPVEQKKRLATEKYCLHSGSQNIRKQGIKGWIWNKKTKT